MKPIYVKLIGAAYIASALMFCARDLARFFVGTALSRNVTGTFRHPPSLGLPDQIGQWSARDIQSDKFELNDMEYTRVWKFQNEALTAHVRIDCPSLGLHELSDCYVARGWTLVNREVRWDDGKPRHIRSLRKDLVASGKLWFSHFNAKGICLSRESPSARALVRVTEAIPALCEPLCQFQVFVESASPLTPFEEASIDKLFLFARECLIHQIVSLTENRSTHG